MSKSLTIEWDMLPISESLGMNPVGTVTDVFEAEDYYINGMAGKTHTEETKKLMRKSAHKSKPHLHKGGVVEKNGVIVKFSCISHFCNEHNLSKGHVTELLQDKRKTVKGWKKYGV